MRKIFLLLVAIVFILSSCSEYKKVDSEKFSIVYNMQRQIGYGAGGKTTTANYTLKSLEINGKNIQLLKEEVKLKPNKKIEIETKDLGVILIKINHKKDGFTITLWMTETQILKIE